FNTEHGIEPRSIRKQVRDILDLVATVESRTAAGRLKGEQLPRDVAVAMARDVERLMKEAAANLEFEKAAALRDELIELRKQIAYNEEHHIDPKSILKSVRDILSTVGATGDGARRRAAGRQLKEVPRDVLLATIDKLEKEMKAAAARLEFEKAAALRDELWELRKQLPDGGDAALSRKAPRVFGQALREAALF
ncbi:MAG: UvrB/UvrC motif-containing protein, partial [Candidatus Eremiobacteraeota bacterium]|nr:UvrB/UvrC motif-containing protein [Candidatus Eremiobacteraeota bacterium]